MQIGVVFPQTEIGADMGAVRAYGTGVEALGYAHLLAYDHVLGADPAVHEGWAGPYDVDTTFHEPFVLFGFLAGITKLELVTGVIILPQRQTALVAKQAAEVDILCEGRFRLGIGVGWNPVEYDALGRSFGDRGVRSAEQIELLRRLFTERSVTFEGRSEHVSGAGIAPLPGAAPDPDLVRRVDASCIPSCRPTRRRMVPDGAARPAPRGGEGDRRRGSTRGGTRPLVDRDGGQGELDTRGRSRHGARSRRAMADHGCHSPRGQHDAAPASRRSTITSPRSRRSQRRRSPALIIKCSRWSAAWCPEREHQP